MTRARPRHSVALPPARGCIGTCTSTVLNAPLERSFAAVGRYEKYVKKSKKKQKYPQITLVVPVTSQTKAEWGGGC